MLELRKQRRNCHLGWFLQFVLLAALSFTAVAGAEDPAGGPLEEVSNGGPRSLEAAVGVLRSLLSPSSANPSASLSPEDTTHAIIPPSAPVHDTSAEQEPQPITPPKSTDQAPTPPHPVSAPPSQPCTASEHCLDSSDQAAGVEATAAPGAVQPDSASHPSTDPGSSGVGLQHPESDLAPSTTDSAASTAESAAASRWDLPGPDPDSAAATDSSVPAAPRADVTPHQPDSAAAQGDSAPGAELEPAAESAAPGAVSAAQAESAPSRPEANRASETLSTLSSTLKAPLRALFSSKKTQQEPTSADPTPQHQNPAPDAGAESAASKEVSAGSPAVDEANSRNTDTQNDSTQATAPGGQVESAANGQVEAVEAIPDRSPPANEHGLPGALPDAMIAESRLHAAQTSPTDTNTGANSDQFDLTSSPVNAGNSSTCDGVSCASCLNETCGGTNETAEFGETDVSDSTGWDEALGSTGGNETSGEDVSGTVAYPNWRLLRDLEIPDAEVTFLLEEREEAQALMASAQEADQGTKPHKKPPTWIPTPEEYSKALEERVKAQANKIDPGSKADSANEGADPGGDSGSRPKQARRRRVNLAAASDGATILSSSKPLKKVEKAIDNDVDTFMKTDCKDDRWLIIELSQLGRVEQLDLTMKELYSCRIKEFVVKGRPGDPRKDGGDYRELFQGEGWQLLGNFTGDNKKGSQTFKVQKDTQLVKFVLIQVVSHWGNEQVCAVNSIRVYGVSAAQDLEDTLSIMTVPTPTPPSLQPPIPDPPSPDPDPPETPPTIPQLPADPSSESPNAAAPAESQGGRSGGEAVGSGGAGEGGNGSGSLVGGEGGGADVSQEGVQAVAAGEGEEAVGVERAPPPAKAPEQPHAADNGADSDVPSPPVLPAKLPSEGGSLYDAIKLEILSLRLNQTLLWGYVRELQSALVQRTMELDHDINATEAGLGGMKARLEEVPKIMQAALNQQVRQLLDLELKSLRSTQHTCNSALAAARQREVGMALWASAAGGLAALAALNGGRRGQLRQAVLVMAVVNGMLGTLMVNLAPLQQLLRSFQAGVDMQQLVGLVGGSRS